MTKLKATYLSMLKWKRNVKAVEKLLNNFKNDVNMNSIIKVYDDTCPLCYINQFCITCPIRDDNGYGCESSPWIDVSDWMYDYNEKYTKRQVERLLKLVKKESDYIESIYKKVKKGEL